jgi:selenocysteine-specific elongation factor
VERTIVVGTAGHIDHGKSALVRALTGVDPDRLKEEKERGITIDIGFAHLPLGAGLVASFIDVPGHERFVRNMLAGAHGIDTVLLVVASDEGVMPQTREHFHICRFLNIPRGALVLTKCDAASPETQAVAEMEVRELVRGSFLDGAPLVRTSAKTGEGVEALKDVLRGFAGHEDARREGDLLRLPVDRSFSVKGFGTVVTGTLVSGSIALEEEIEVLPKGSRARVRGIEVHGAPVPRVGAGHRVALNLAGVEVQEVVRGDVLARPATLHATHMLDAEIDLLPSPKPLRDQARVRFHAGSAEILARVHVLDGPLVQLRLEAPAVVGRGDRFILRAYSPSVTIGGGVVLDPLPRKQRKRGGATLDRLRALRGASPAEAASVFVQASGQEGTDAGALQARVTTTMEELLPALERDPGVALLGGTPPGVISTRALAALGEATLAFLAAFHRANPLKDAVPREEVRRKVFAHAPLRAFDTVVETLGPRLRLTPSSIALAGEGVRLSSKEEAARAELLALALDAGLQGLESGKVVTKGDRDLAGRVLQLLVSEGTLARVGDQMLVHRSHLDSLKSEVRRRWPPGSRLDVGELKNVTGLSRKFVIPLLEFLDRERVTRRTGADRFVLP